MESTDLKNAPLYNSRIIDTYIKLIKNKYSFVNISELLSHAGMKPYEIADEAHWFTQEQINLFYNKLVLLTGNDNIAREAGRFVASPEAMGVMRPYFLGLTSPVHAFEILKATNLVKSSVYESTRLAPNKVEIVVTPFEEGIEQPFQCENRIGFFEAIVIMFNNKMPDIQHIECMFAGGKVCRYIITWEKSKVVFYRKIRNWGTLLLVGLNLLLLLTSQWFSLQCSLPFTLFFICFLAIATERSEKNEFKASLEHTKDSVDELLAQIKVNFNNALVTNEIGQALSTHTRTEDVLADVIHIMEKQLDFGRGLILLANRDKTELELHACYGYSDYHKGYFQKIVFHLDRPDLRGIFKASFSEQKPFLVNDLNEIEDILSTRSLEFAKKLGTRSFICCPIICEDESLGILAVENIMTKRPLVQSDMSLLMWVASVLGISIRNAELIEGRFRQFNSVLQVLAASIDARDSLTSGHSEKVTQYSLGICAELGLSNDYQEMIRVAALLHDYGKIGIPDHILKKEGRLTPEEYRVIKEHSDKTREILERINFEGIYCQVPEIAGAHHEKVNGTGYPKGLKGNEIPLGAKIIAVADYFEAITTKRHYREPMEIEEAFWLLREESGRHFEKELVEAFITYYSKNFPDSTGNMYNSFQRMKCGNIRLPYRASVVLRLGERTSEAICEDISSGGMYVASIDIVAEGESVNLSIVLSDPAKPAIEAKGRVAWVNNQQARRKPALPHGFGVELLEFQMLREEFFVDLLDRSLTVH